MPMKDTHAFAYLPLENAPLEVIGFLNGEQPLEEGDREELERLVNLWLECGFDLNKMRQRIGALRIKSLPVRGTFYLDATKEGRPVLIPYPEEGTTHAQGIFLHLVLYPHAEQLAGPCDRCGKYFLKTTRHRRAFCSRACLAFSTAVKATQKAREKKSAERLAWAEEGIADWQRAKRRDSWKTWTVRHMKKAHGEYITEKSLSRWVNEGRLTAPNGVGRS